MKHKFIKENKYLAWGLTAFFVVAASAFIVFLIFNYKIFAGGFSSFLKVLTPIIDGIVLAYLLTPVLNLVETQWVGWFYRRSGKTLSVRQKRHRRNISIVITLVIVIGVLTLFFMIVIPQLILSFQSIIFQLPVYINNLEDFATELLDNNPDVEKIVNSLFNTYSTQVTDFLQNSILPQVNVLIKSLSLGIISFLKGTFNFIVGFIISVYLMASKETMAGQAKKIVYSLYDTHDANKIIAGIRYTHQTFIGFVGGKIIDSIIIGILTFIVTSIIGTPYAVLVSVIVGVTNVIPFFGPYIGAIPSALLVLMVNPLECLYFIIAILIIQQIDGNIIGPKILGDSTGLSSFWVIFSITLFGGIFGIAGMILGVPTFGVIYALIRYKINHRLKKKKMPQDTGYYINVGSIEPDGSYMEYVPVKGRSLLELLGVKKGEVRRRKEIIEDDSSDSDPETDTESRDQSDLKADSEALSGYEPHSEDSGSTDNRAEVQNSKTADDIN